MKTVEPDEAFSIDDMIKELFPGAHKEVVGFVEELRADLDFARQRGRNPLDQMDLMNYLFVGPPGTGKTTVARLMGKLFKTFGLLSSSEVVEKQPKDFETGFVGQSGGRTEQIMDEAKGKVLFIDEAYGFDPAQGGNQFRKEAVDTLVAAMTRPEYNGKMVIILAGCV